MKNSKFDERLEKRLRFSHPEDLIPVKLVAEREYRETILEVKFAPRKQVTAVEEAYITPGLQALVNELEKQNIEYIPFFQSKQNPSPYIIATLDQAQIKDFARRNYVAQILDDSPII